MMADMTHETVDQLWATEDGMVFFRVASEHLVDGQVTTQYKRQSLSPGQDTSGLPAEVQAFCSETWTPDVVDAYEASLSSPTSMGP
jgi:hypothetical protein